MNIRLICNNTSLDLRDGESIKVIDSIQDSKDISKITAPYSRQFNLPATAKNNIFFKHYYNFDILNGYDAREKVDCFISISGFLFKRGKLRLNGVSIDNGTPRSYKVVFFGDELEFKDLIGDDLLSSLDLTDFNHLFTDSIVRTGLETGLSEGGLSDTNPKLVYPFISHTRRFIYDSTNGVYAEGETGNSSKVSKEDLKPAIQCKVLTDKIAEKYGFTWESNFFNSEIFKGLFLWLHRKEGGALVDADNNNVGVASNLLSDLTLDSGLDVIPLDTTGGDTYYILTWNVTYVGTSNYTITVTDLDNGNVLASQTVEGGGNTSLVFQVGINPAKVWNLDFTLEALDLIAINQTLDIDLYEIEDFGGAFLSASGTYSFPSNDVTNQIVIKRLMPNVKIFDFLQLLFKAFNLTAYKNDDGEVVIEPLPDFLANPKTWDISEYISLTKDVSRLFPYKSLKFGFKGRDTFLLSNRDELLNAKFGDLEYSGSNPDLDGGDYKIELEAEKVLYERLADANNNLSSILYGWTVDKKKEPRLTKPLLFFNRNRAVGSSIFTFKTNGSSVTLSNYNAPSNTFKESFATDSNCTLNFGTELDEYSLESNENSLFYKYYRDFVGVIYNKRSRSIKVTAYLPLSIVLNYALNDVFIIYGRRYRIEKIATDVITGKSELELYNDLQTEKDLENNANRNTVESEEVGLTVSTITTSTIKIDWDKDVLGASGRGVSLYLNDEHITDVNYTDQTYTFTSLLDDTNYKVGFKINLLNYSTPIFERKVTTEALSSTALSGTWDDDNGDFSNTLETFDIG